MERFLMTLRLFDMFSKINSTVKNEINVIYNIGSVYIDSIIYTEGILINVTGVKMTLKVKQM